jgi:hypothetical protein
VSTTGRLAVDATSVLRGNDRGGWTRPSSGLYPHQWSWDSAFCAIGWATFDPSRALSELEHLFAAQWADGRVPHIVYRSSAPADSYFPGPDRWKASSLPASPRGFATSAIVQPPVHAIALRRVWSRARTSSTAEDLAGLAERVAALWPKLAAWHRYLRVARDPTGSGLVTIWHPWESGLDNSPRWDGPLSRLVVGELEPYERVDTAVVDGAQRPTDGDYDRYVWLVQCGASLGWDDAAMATQHPFRVADVLSSALLAAADDALASLANDLADLGRVVADQATITALHLAADRTRVALDGRWDENSGLCLDLDQITGEPLAARTIAGFAPLVAGGLLDWSRELLARLDSPGFCGDVSLRWATPPTTAADDPAFDPRSYWRGPTWPVITWLVWWALRRGDHHERAAQLRAAALDQLAAVGFPEYVDPITGEPLGSPDQSWTAAVALDWLADPL